MSHTPGPWFWSVNSKHKSIELTRGQYGDVVMGFRRWGMGNATPMFRDMGILKRAVDFSVVVPSREHHEDWWRTLGHPDARMIAAAPELLEALERILPVLEFKVVHLKTFASQEDRDMLEVCRAAIAKAKGRT